MPDESTSLPPFLARAVASQFMTAEQAAEVVRMAREVAALSQDIPLDEIAEIKGYLTEGQVAAIKDELYKESDASYAEFLGASSDVTEAAPPAAVAAPTAPAPAPAPEPAASGRRIIACACCKAKISTERPDGAMAVCAKCGGAFVIGGEPIEAIVVPHRVARHVIACPSCALRISTVRPIGSPERCPRCAHAFTIEVEKPPAPDPNAPILVEALAAVAASTPVTPRPSASEPPAEPAPAAPPPAPAAAPPPPPAREPAPHEIAGRLNPGDPIGDCKIESCLGSRSWSAAYIATRPNLSRVRLKVLGPVRDAGARAAFLQEMTAIIKAAEPLAGKGFAVPRARAEAGEFLFVVGDLVRGPALYDTVRGRPIDATSAAALVAKVARRVDALHAIGLAHGRIRFGNIVLDPAGDPWLLDLRPSVPDADGPDARPAEKRDDIRALGRLLREATQGRLTDEIAAVAERLLEEEGAAPYARARDAARALEHAIGVRSPASSESGSGSRRLAPPPKKRRVPAALVGAGAALPIAAAVLFFGLRMGLRATSMGDGAAEAAPAATQALPTAGIGTSGSRPFAPPRPGDQIDARRLGLFGPGSGHDPSNPYAPSGPGTPSSTPAPAVAPPAAAPPGPPIDRAATLDRVANLIQIERLEEANVALATLGEPRSEESKRVEELRNAIRATGARLADELDSTARSWLLRRRAVGCGRCGFLREVACPACRGSGRRERGGGACGACTGAGRIPCDAGPACVRGFAREGLRATALDPLAASLRGDADAARIDAWLEAVATAALGGEAAGGAAANVAPLLGTALRPLAQVGDVSVEVAGSGHGRVRAQVAYRGRTLVTEETVWTREAASWRLCVP